MKGIVGRFFFQFGIAMSVAVGLSLLEALTLTPMRCSQFLTKGNEGWIARHMNHFMKKLSLLYKNILVWSLDRRVFILTMAFLVFMASLFLLGKIKKEFVPPQDQSQFLVTIQTPMGSSLESSDRVFREAEKNIESSPRSSNYFVAIGGFQGGLVNQGNMFITLKDPDIRPVSEPFHHKPSQVDFMKFVREKFLKLWSHTCDCSRSFTRRIFISTWFSCDLFDSRTELEDDRSMSAELMKKMSESGLMTDIDSDYNPNMPELQYCRIGQKLQSTV